MAASLGPRAIFLTLTFPQKCEMVKQSLLPGQQPAERDDLIMRGYRMFINKFKTDVLKNHIFGKAKGFFGITEFQKR